jgi:hypothetical protein
VKALRPDNRVVIDLPASWDFMRLVLPHLHVEALGGPALTAACLIEPGLELLERQSEATTSALTGADDFSSRSGLPIWVQTCLWERADRLRARFTREAVFAGRDEWTTRRVLLSALAAQGRKLSGSWPLRDDVGDYEHHHEEARP